MRAWLGVGSAVVDTRRCVVWGVVAQGGRQAWVKGGSGQRIDTMYFPVPTAESVRCTCTSVPAHACVCACVPTAG